MFTKISKLLLLFFLLASQAGAKGWRFYYDEGLLHFNNERYDNALYYFKRALQHNKDHYIIHRAIGKCYQLNKRPYEAIAAYHTSIRLNPKQPGILLFLAEFHSSKRNYKAAEKMYQRFYRLEKNNAEANIRFAVTMAQLNKRQRARQLLREISTANQSVQTECGQHEKAHRNKAAYFCFRKLLFLNPIDTTNFFALIRLEEKGVLKPTVKENWARDLFLLFGNEEKNAWPLFFQHYRSKKFQKARVQLKKIIEVAPKSRLAYFFKAEIERETKNSSKAEELYQKAMKLN